MIRIACLLLIGVVVLTGCGSSLDFSALKAAIIDTDSMTKLQGTFVTEMTFDDKKATLLFRQGGFSADKENALFFYDYSEVYLGVSASKTVNLYDGYIYEDSEGEKYRHTKEDLSLTGLVPFSAFYDFDFNSAKSKKLYPRGEGQEGDIYTFTLKDQKEDFIKSVFGDSIYNLTLIRAPQREETRYGDIKVEYVVDDTRGLLLSFSVTFDITLYETPPYTPGYTPPKEDYALNIKVSSTIKFKEFGEAVSISPPAIEKYLDSDGA